MQIRLAVPEDFTKVEPHWQALYQHQYEHGMLLRLPEGAYEAWVKSMVPLLGRFSVMSIAEEDGAIVGFVAGRIRTLPPYFGSSAVGFVSEVFVDPSKRGAGTGRQLLAMALDWFAAQGITRTELQVVAGNPDGLRFYRQLGWHEELVQMVHLAPPPK
jgi:GNAT superfamily N-acetyltransferase